MINSASHDNVSRLVTDRSMCFAVALDKAFENIDCMSAILRCQAKNRFYESTQRLIQPRRVLWPIIDKDTSSLGFTGGEPLLDWRDFINVLAVCRDELPKTAIHVLSNGRAFVGDEVVRAWAGIRHPNLTVGIPIYAAVDYIHDHVVQARGAFDETVLGVLKLKNEGQRVEIRVVLHALTAPRIVETCKWFARNLPFVDHVALMGLENTGFAIANAEELWIDPVDYRSELGRVDGFDQDKAESKRDEGAVILRRLLASKRDTLKRLSLPTVCSMRARAL